jgi:hypothetical protein
MCRSLKLHTVIYAHFIGLDLMSFIILGTGTYYEASHEVILCYPIDFPHRPEHSLQQFVVKRPHLRSSCRVKGNFPFKKYIC